MHWNMAKLNRRYVSVAAAAGQVQRAAWCLLVSAFFCLAARAGLPPVQTYYLPITMEEAYWHYQDLEYTAQGGPNASTNIVTIISIVSSVSNTVLYLDQWENGFDADPANPTNLWSVSNPGGTQIWGDNNPANGIPPGFTQDIIQAGNRVILQVTNLYPRTASVVSYDGGDKIAATKPISITEVLWPTNCGPLIAEGCEVYDTSVYGTNFVAPVGVDSVTVAPLTFSSSRLAIMAASDNTVVMVDTNADSVFDVTNTLNQGQGWLAPGRVKAGARVVASKPVQVHELTGQIGANYASRWYTLYSKEVWSSRYATPVYATTNTYPAAVFLYNDSAANIAVSYQTLTTSGTTNVPANGWTRFNLGGDSGAAFWTTSGVPFEAALMVDAGPDYDWGGSLIPLGLWSPMIVAGYAEGSGDGTANGSPLWVMALSNTVVLVDYDGDSRTGPYTDPYGNRYDTNYVVAAFQTLRLRDMSDNSQTGLRAYTTNEVPLVAMWGEDPALSAPGFPYIDAGTGVVPVPTFRARKAAELLFDLNGNSRFDPGDTIRWTVTLVNGTLRPLNNALLEDPLPSNTVYVAGSSTVDGEPLADDEVPPYATVYPFDEGGRVLGGLPAGAARIVTFQTTITNPLPPGVFSVDNVCVGQIEAYTDVHTQDVALVMADVELSKQAGSATGYVGDAVIFTISATNRGPDAAGDLTVREFIPAGLAYRSHSGGTFDTNSGIWTIGTLPAGAATSLVLEVEILSAGAWTNLAEVWTSSVYDPDSAPGNGLSEDDAASASVTGLWHADLAVVKSVDNPAPVTNETVVYTVMVSNGGPANTTGVMVSEPLASGLELLSNSVTRGAYDEGTGIWTVGALAANESAVMTLWARVTAPQGSGVTNESRIVHSDLADRQPTNDAAQAAVFVSVLRVSKTADTDFVGPGSNITYTIVVSNAGASTQSGVTVQDAVPAGTHFATGSVSIAFDPPTVLWATGWVQDAFSAVSYENNNGLFSWAGPWQEGGEADGPAAGFALVSNQQACLSHDRSLTRAVNLDRTQDAALEFVIGEISTTVTNSWADLFNAVSYANNNGSKNWLAAWQEGGEADGPSAGAAQVSPAGHAVLATNRSLSRAMDTDGATNLLLSFWFRQPATAETNTVLDQFSSATYTNNNGTWTWSRPWVETNDDGSATITGNKHVYISAGVLYFDSCTPNQGIERRANSGSATNAVLSFTQTTTGLDPNEYLAVYALSNGTAILLGKYGGGTNGTSTVTFPFPLGTNVGVRFLTEGTWANNEDAYVDNVQITFVSPLFESNDIATVSVSSNGTSWTTVFSLTGTVSAVWQSAQVDISSWVSTSTWVRLAVTNYEGPGESVFFDNIAVTSRAPNLTSADTALVEASSNGVDWTALLTWTGNFGGPVSTSMPLAAYATSNTAVRFRVSGYGDPEDILYFDDVTVRFRYTGATGAPPVLASNFTLAAGQTMTVRYTVTADNPLYYGAITNTASAVSHQQPAPRSDSVVVSTMKTDLEVTKTVDNDNPHEGSNIVFAIVVTNAGPTRAYGVNISDALPAGLAYVSHVASQGTYSTNTGVWTVGDLDVDASARLDLSARAEPGTAGLRITNVAQIASMSPADSAPGNNVASQAVRVFSVDLALQKIANTTNPWVGGTVEYALSVTNLGVNEATGVVISEHLTNGLSYAGHYASTGSYDSGAGLWTIPSLPAGGGATLRLTANVATNTDGRSITNIAVITNLDQTETQTTNNESSCVVVPRLAHLQIAKATESAELVDVGDPVAYRITVSNNDIAAHTGIRLEDPLPAGLTAAPGSTILTCPVPTNRVWADDFSSRSYGVNAGDTNFIGPWQELEGDGPTSGVIRVDDDSGYRPGHTLYSLAFSGAGAGATSWIARTADLTAFTNGTLRFDYRNAGISSNAILYVQVSSDGFSASVSNVVTLTAGAPATYRTTNVDVSAFAGAQMSVRFFTTNMLPTDLMWFDDVRIEASDRRAHSFAGGDPPTLAQDITLMPGEILTVAFTGIVASPPAVWVVTNTASVTSDLLPQPLASSATNGVARGDVELWKEVSDPTPDTNEVIWFTLTLTNHGPHRVRNIEVRDFWPDLLVFSNAWVSAGSYDASAGTVHVWTVESLDPGMIARAVVTAEVNAASKYVGITNTAGIVATHTWDVNTGNHTSSVELMTLVVVTRFEAWSDGETGQVEWETASEVGTLGFELEREAGGRWARVTPRLIPARPNARAGATYRARDEGLRPGVTATYRLIEHERGGRKIVYGPFAVVVESRAGGTMGAGGGDRNPASVEPRTSARSSRSTVLSLAGSLPDASGTAGAKLAGTIGGAGVGFMPLWMIAREAGWHRVSASELAAVMRVTEDEVRARLARGEPRILNRGREIYRRLTQDAAIEFFAEALRTVYTEENAYRLEWAAGSPVEIRRVMDADPAPSDQTFQDTVHMEKDVWDLPAFASDPLDDYWYWHYLIAGDQDWDTAEEAVELPGLAEGTAGELKLHLVRVGGEGVADEHHLVVSVNGAEVGRYRGQGIGTWDLTIPLASGVLIPGENRIGLKAVLSEGISYSILVWNSADVTFARRYEADRDELWFRGAGHSAVTVRGFSSADITVLNMARPRRPRVLAGTRIEPDAGRYRVSFQPEGPDVPYYAFARPAVRAPAALRPAAVTDWASTDRSGRYVVITVPELAGPAERLADYRRSQGFSAQVVFVGDLYDQFSYGMKNPEAIRSFLRAAAAWAQPPAYVALAGEGSYDYRNLWGYGDSQVPTLMTPTCDGLFGSDAALADTDGDGAPDVAVGRLPARTPEELDALISKIIRYEQADKQDWGERVILAADNPDAGGHFDVSSGHVEEMLPFYYSRERIYLSTTSVSRARQRLMAALDDGSAVLSYFGHGGLDVLAAERLLTAGDVEQLRNAGREPVVTAVSCIVGDFSLPGFDTLGKTLLLKSDGGAIGVWAPTGLSQNEKATILARELYQAIFQEGVNVLGDAVRLAARRYRDRRGFDPMLYLYNLMGDPALHVADVPRGLARVRWELWRHERFSAEECRQSDVSGEQADPDRDRQPNLWEFAVGGQPTLPDDGAALALRNEPDGNEERWEDAVVTYRRNRQAAGVIYRVEVSADLVEWRWGSDYAREDAVMDDGNGATETVRVRIRSPDRHRPGLFVRLKVLVP